MRNQEVEIERYFGTCSSEEALKMLERIKLILRARMIIKPERKRRQKGKDDGE